MILTLRRDPIEGSIYARKGEKTFCANGHYLGTIAKDVYFGRYADPADFELAPGTEIGMESCPTCAAPVAWDGCYYFEETRH